MSLMRSPKQFRSFITTTPNHLSPNTAKPLAMSSTSGQPLPPSQNTLFPQSLSGSETDISTSNENLSNEEKYVIRHTERQEPQGEENLQSASNRNSLRDSLQSNRSSLDVSSSSYNTLIIHSIGDETWTGRNSGPKDDLFTDYSSADVTAELTELTEMPADYLSQSSVLKHLAKESLSSAAPPEYAAYMKLKSRLPVKSASKNTAKNAHSVVMRKKSSRSTSTSSPPSTAAGSAINAANSMNAMYANSKVPLSKSQPDLRQIAKMDDGIRWRPRTNDKEDEEDGENGDGRTVWTLEFLIKENHALKLELEQCYMRVSKSQKLEEEVLKIHRSHEELVQSCDRRERLERAARARLQSDCQRLQELNRTLKDQIALLSNDGLRREVSKRELLITQLITQNKEFQAAKDRQEIELTAQRATLQEQRTHIDILEAALTNAQGNVVRLEDENRKKQVYVERVVQLQRALSSLQLASDRREQTERQLRQQLESELERSKMQGDAPPVTTPTTTTSCSAENPELKRRLRDREEKIMRLEGECSKWEQRYLEEAALRQAAIDAASIPKDAKIAALEKTSQETEKIIAEARTEKIRHMDEAHAAQKKVADLEARLKACESRLAERDAMIRVLQKHAYDKDVVVGMLGRSPHHTPHQSIGSRDDLVSSVLTSSTSFGSGSACASYAGSTSDASSAASTSFLQLQAAYAAASSYDSTKQTLDHQIKEIDSQLDSHMLSKRALCCFPGFAHPVAAPRKGKLPQPLLASVTNSSSSTCSTPPPTTANNVHSQNGGSGCAGNGSSGGGIAAKNGGGNTNIGFDNLLMLEKQGRSSQQQRMPEPVSGGHTSANNPNHLPPSSLPRPPRSKPSVYTQHNPHGPTGHPASQRKKSDGSLSSGSSRTTSPARSLIPPPRKVEYGRLSDGSGSRSGSIRARSTDRDLHRDSGSTIYSDQSASSLPNPSKVRFYNTGSGGRSSGASVMGSVGGSIGAGRPRRSASLARDARDSKSSTDSTTVMSSNKFRIQF